MRSYTDVNPVDCKCTTITIRQEWDRCGNQLWSYFDEEVKRHIEYFLLERLNGRNLEVGGGWYLSYPNSDVVDVSPVCLRYNIAPKHRKHFFDLDTLAKGKRLPFKNGTFDSATLVSVWQYLPHAWDLVAELERVLKPGSEVYIINGDGAGNRNVIANDTSIGCIEQEFKEKGYDTLVEPVPDTNGGTGGPCFFSSLCVALPENRDGKRVSRLVNKRSRVAAVQSFDSHAFLDRYRRYEADIQLEKLGRLAEYPVTKYSKLLERKAEAFSREYESLTGDRPLFYFDNDTQIQVDMALPGKEPHLEMTVLEVKGGKTDSDVTDRLAKKHNLHFARCINHLSMCLGTESVNMLKDNIDSMVNDVLNSSSKSASDNIDHIAAFLVAPKLNGFARDFSKELLSLLDHRGVCIQTRMRRKEAWNLSFLAYSYKQRRRIDELIKVKSMLKSKSSLVAGTGTFDIEYWRPFVVSHVMQQDQEEPVLARKIGTLQKFAQFSMDEWMV